MMLKSLQNFLKFNKPIVVDLYTCRKDVYEFSQPKRASKFIPEWWKKLDKGYFSSNGHRPASTMRKCAGFLDNLRYGFVLPMWSDVQVSVGQQGSNNWAWVYSDGRSNASSHEQSQRGDFLPDFENLHLKLHCPWTAVCSEDLHWQMLQPTWNMDDPFEYITPPAIVNFKLQHSLEVHTFFRRKDVPELHVIPHGRPMLHLVPLSERTVELRYHLVSEEEFEKYTSVGALLKFSDGYAMIKKTRLENGGCPYHKQ